MGSGEDFVSCFNPKTGDLIKTYLPQGFMTDKVQMAFDSEDNLHVVYVDEYDATRARVRYMTISDNTPTVPDYTDVLDLIGVNVRAADLTSSLFLIQE